MTEREKRLFIGSFFLFLFLWILRISFEGSSFCNDQFGFGLFPFTKGFFVVEVCLLLALFWLGVRTLHFSEKLIFSILLVGGFSNLSERMLFGCVLDYIKLPFIGSYINGADILITGALIAYFFLYTNKEEFKS